MTLTQIKDYNVSNQDSLFFDANVWLLIFGNVANSRQERQKAYSQLLKDAISRNATIFISSLVLSEIINRMLRIDFEQWLEVPDNIGKKFKRDFRQTEEYKESLQSAIETVKEILKISIVEKVDDGFHSRNTEILFSRMGNYIDFNDSYYISLCFNNQWKLVSDDSDFKNSGSTFCLITYQ